MKEMYDSEQCIFKYDNEGLEYLIESKDRVKHKELREALEAISGPFKTVSNIIQTIRDEELDGEYF